MAQPDTLDKKMRPTDLLVLTCQGCDYTHEATKQKAQKRYGSRATGYYIERKSVCPNCGSRNITAEIARDRPSPPRRN